MDTIKRYILSGGLEVSMPRKFDSCPPVMDIHRIPRLIPLFIGVFAFVLPGHVFASTDLTNITLPFVDGSDSFDHYFRGENNLTGGGGHYDVIFYNDNSHTKGDASGTTVNVSSISGVGSISSGSGCTTGNPCSYVQQGSGSDYKVEAWRCDIGAFTNCSVFDYGGPDYVQMYTSSYSGDQPAFDYWGGSGYNPLAPPTTDDNEVTNYIPQPGVSTTTGTTTVGATFSIGQPDWIIAFGYRILDPNNNVVFDSSTTPTGAGTYSISTAYNFTQNGIYQGHAYFIQDLGGGNIWTVDNPTIQQISVNLTGWTTNPDGSFTQNPATTSTTTLGNLTLDCGTGFTGSICNLVAHLVIPQATSLQLVQGAFNQITNKAPFSFFTDARNVLGAFNVSSSTGATGGTFALSLYGESVPIISTTTAAGIGLGDTSINALKFIISWGLWILLAWYLYWRIASIFGV